MKYINIPIPAIVLCFVFGAWPIGIVLLILRSINESNKNEAKKEKNKNAEKFEDKSATHTVYHSKYNKSDSSDKTVEPDTTYHYSYVKRVPEELVITPEEKPQENKKSASDPKNEAGINSSKVKSQAERAVNYVKLKYKRSTATVLTTIFMSISIVFAFIFFVNAIDFATYVGITGAIGEIISAMVASSIAAVLYLFRQYFKSRDYRIITYLSILRGKKYYSIKTLADIADVSVARVVKDLHFMQSKDLLGPYALIDKKMQYLILAPDGREGARDEYERENGLTRKQIKEEREKTVEEAAKGDLSEHEKILARIRELNDDIDDETVSRKIDEIEEVTRKIFKLVEEKPELESQLESFLSYYLPTTLKLLNSYAYFEEQGVRGENISAGMKNIEETLDMLISGYRHQLDKLFESDTLDVTTDINVLEQMMKADGFTKHSDFNVTNEAKSFAESGFGGAAFAEDRDQTKKE